MKKKKIIGWIGFAVTLVAFLFIFKKLQGYAIDLSDLFEARTIVAILLLSVTYAVCVLVRALAYQALYRNLCGDSIPKWRTVKVYVQSNLYRYIPGNVLHYVGRNQLAVEYGVSHVSVAGVTLLEIIILAVASVFTAAVFDFRLFMEMLGRIPLWGWIAAAAVLVIGGGVLFYKRIPQRVAKTYFSAMNASSVRVLAVQLIVRIALFVAYGWQFFVTLELAGASRGVVSFVTVVGIYAVCWFVGFVMPGAPGGLGVREALLLHFFGAFFDSGLVLQAAIIMRLVTILGDVFAFLVSLAIPNGGKTQETAPEAVAGK